MKTILFVFALFFISTATGWGCEPFNVVCGVKHGHKSSSHPKNWGIGHHNESYKDGACRPSGGSHCGDHHILTYEDMPHNSVNTEKCYEKATKRGTDYCSAIGKGKILSDPISEIWAAVFASACHLHDICYSVKGAKKDKCDDDLKKNFSAICEKLPVTPKAGRDPVIGRVNCHTVIPGWTSDDVFKHMEAAWKAGQNWAKQKCD